MRKVELEQGSAEWHNWRLQGLGASELPVILGEVPKNYGTRSELLAVKRGGPEKKKNDFVLEKGKEIEKKVRAKFEMTADGEFSAVCAELGDGGFIRASFDGLGLFPIEIKYCGEKNLNLVTKHHWIQIQQQMAVAEADKMLLIKSANGIDTCEIWIEFNSWFWKQALKEIKKFEKEVKNAR